MLKVRVIERLMRYTRSRTIFQELRMVKQVTSSDWLHLETQPFHFKCFACSSSSCSFNRNWTPGIVREGILVFAFSLPFLPFFSGKFTKERNEINFPFTNICSEGSGIKVNGKGYSSTYAADFFHHHQTITFKSLLLESILKLRRIDNDHEVIDQLYSIWRAHITCILLRCIQVKEKSLVSLTLWNVLRMSHIW